MPTSVTVAKKGQKSVICVIYWKLKKNGITVMLSWLKDGTNLSPYVILKLKTMPKETMPLSYMPRKRA